MATIAENLLALQTAKENIKTAIESKGQDLTDVPFTEYSNKINAITTSDKPDMLQARVDSNNSCAYLFYQYKGNDIDFISGLDVNKVKDFGAMFSYSDRIETIPPLNMSVATNTSAMFQGCSRLLSIPTLNIDNVTDINYMFEGCQGLTKLPITNLGKTTNISYICRNCYTLTEIPQFDTSKITNMDSAFYGCKGLTAIPLLDTSNVTKMSHTFRALEKVVEFPQLDTKNVTDMRYMLSGNLLLTTIKGLDLRSVTDASNMFYNCQNLTNLTLKNIKVKLQISSGTQYGHLLTLDSLTNTIKELWDKTGSTTQTLTVGSANLEKLANVYVKLIDITDEMRAEDEYIDNKKPFEVCESTDEGAMTIQEYVTSKNWQLA